MKIYISLHLNLCYLQNLIGSVSLSYYGTAWTKRVLWLVPVIIIMFFIRLNNFDFCQLFNFFDVVGKRDAVIFNRALINKLSFPVKSALVHSRIHHLTVASQYSRLHDRVLRKSVPMLNQCCCIFIEFQKFLALMLIIITKHLLQLCFDLRLILLVACIVQKQILSLLFYFSNQTYLLLVKKIRIIYRCCIIL